MFWYGQHSAPIVFRCAQLKLVAMPAAGAAGLCRCDDSSAVEKLIA